MYKVCFVSVREGAGHRHRSGRIQQYLPLAQRHQLPETVHSENRDRTKALAGQLHQRLKKKKKKNYKKKAAVQPCWEGTGSPPRGCVQGEPRVSGSNMEKWSGYVR